MRLVYAPRAVRDLRSIAAYYRSATDEKTPKESLHVLSTSSILSFVTRILRRVSGGARKCDQPRSRAIRTLFFIEFAAMRSKSCTFATRHAGPGRLMDRTVRA